MPSRLRAGRAAGRARPAGAGPGEGEGKGWGAVGGCVGQCRGGGGRDAERCAPTVLAGLGGVPSAGCAKGGRIRPLGGGAPLDRPLPAPKIAPYGAGHRGGHGRPLPPLTPAPRGSDRGRPSVTATRPSRGAASPGGGGVLVPAVARPAVGCPLAFPRLCRGGKHPRRCSSRSRRMGLYASARVRAPPYGAHPAAVTRPPCPTWWPTLSWHSDSPQPGPTARSP